MADNTTLNVGTGGDSISTDDLGTVKVQRVKVQYGADGSATDVSLTTPLPVAQLDSAQTAQNIAMASTANAVSLSSLNGAGGVAVQVTGTWTGTLIFEGTIDGTNWFTTNLQAISGTGVLVSTATANGQWQGDIGGFVGFRVRCSITGTGTAVASIRASLGATAVAIELPLPAGTNVIGALSANQSTNIAQMNGVAVTMGTGASGTGVQRVAIATDGQGQIADNAAFTDGTTRLDMAGHIFDETAGTALTENDAAAARIDSKRAQIMVIEDVTTRGTTNRAGVNTSQALQVTQTPHTAGGLTPATGTISSTATSLKAAAGQVYGYQFYNSNAAVAYVQFFNTVVGSVVVGTTPPVYSIAVPAGQQVCCDIESGIAHSTAIVIAGTTTRAGNTAPTTPLDYNVYYK